MGYSDKKLREILQQAANVTPVDIDTAPVNMILAMQGGGARSIAVAEAAKVFVREALKVGNFSVIGGTSGSAANAALTAKALNEGHGIEGVTRNLDDYWQKIRSLGRVFGVRRTPFDAYLPPEDRWPNIPQTCLSFAEAFRSVNPITRAGLPTASIKEMIDASIGNWDAVQNGPTAIHINCLKRNIFTGHEEYQDLTGYDVNADTVARSAGLDELGGHFSSDEYFSPLHWMTGNIHQYRDGGYRFNPDISTMIDQHAATDVIVIALHEADKKNKAPREEKLYTDHIHRDLTAMLLDDGRRVNFHVIQINLPGNATSSLNTDPDYLDLMKKLGRTQAEAQVQAIVDSLGVRSSYQPHSGVLHDMIQKREIVCT